MYAAGSIPTKSLAAPALPDRSPDGVARVQAGFLFLTQTARCHRSELHEITAGCQHGHAPVSGVGAADPIKRWRTGRSGSRQNPALSLRTDGPAFRCHSVS